MFRDGQTDKVIHRDCFVSKKIFKNKQNTNFAYNYCVRCSFRPKRKLYRPPPVLTKYEPPQLRSIPGKKIKKKQSRKKERTHEIKKNARKYERKNITPRNPHVWFLFFFINSHIFLANDKIHKWTDNNNLGQNWRNFQYSLINCLWQCTRKAQGDMRNFNSPVTNYWWSMQMAFIVIYVHKLCISLRQSLEIVK